LLKSIKQNANSGFAIARALLGNFRDMTHQSRTFANDRATSGLNCLRCFDYNLIANFGSAHIDRVLKLSCETSP